MDDSQDMKAANQFYHSFISMLRWIVPSIALIALFVIILISS